MAETLQRLGPEVELAEMQGSAFVKPQSILYQLDGAWVASFDGGSGFAGGW
jgi:hypothetical protein